MQATQTTPLRVARDEISVGETVALGFFEGHGGTSYEWEVASGPDTADDQLLPDRGRVSRVNSFRPTEAGTYEIAVTVDGERTHAATVEVTDDPVFAGQTRRELLASYAPVLNFHEDEDYYPTRYDAYFEHSTLKRATHGVPTERDDVLADPATALDLGLRFDDGSEYYLEPQDWGASESDYEDYQDRSVYPPTVHGAVHEGVEYEGESYVALSYWMFYVHDPKPDDIATIPGTEKRPMAVAAHTGDQEPVVVLVNESGPQWVGAQQHFGGELRRWDHVDTGDGGPELFVAEGAHSNFFGPYGGATDGGRLAGPAGPDDRPEYLYQKQFYCDGPIDCLPELSPLAIGYSDHVGFGERWVHEDRAQATAADESYEIVVLSGDEAWAEYDGDLYRYTGVSRGSVPMDSGKWGSDDVPAWLGGTLHPDHEQVNATFTFDESIGPDDPVDRVDESDPALETTLHNTGLQPDDFVVTVEAERIDGAADQVEYDVYLNTGEPTVDLGERPSVEYEVDYEVYARVDVEKPTSWKDGGFIDADLGADVDGDVDLKPGEVDPSYEVEPETVTVDVPLPEDVSEGTWDVDLTLAMYNESLREDRHVLDTAGYTVAASEQRALVDFVEDPGGAHVPDGNVPAEVEVTNLDDEQRTYTVDYTVVRPEPIQFDGPGGGSPFYSERAATETVTLGPGESTTVDVSWTVPADAPAGVYTATTSVKRQPAGANRPTRVDRAVSEGSFVVAPQPHVAQMRLEEVTDDDIVLNATVANLGASADRQTVAFSLPGMNGTDGIRVADDGTSFDGSAVEVYAPGEEVFAEYGQTRTTLQYPLVEASVPDWDHGEVEHLTVRLPADQHGANAYVKSVAVGGAGSLHTFDPGPRQATHRDQQSEYAFRVRLAETPDVHGANVSLDPHGDAVYVVPVSLPTGPDGRFVTQRGAIEAAAIGEADSDVGMRLFDPDGDPVSTDARALEQVANVTSPSAPERGGWKLVIEERDGVPVDLYRQTSYPVEPLPSNLTIDDVDRRAGGTDAPRPVSLQVRATAEGEPYEASREPDASMFDVTIGGEQVDDDRMVATADRTGTYRLHLAPPPQSEPGSYDLEVAFTDERHGVAHTATAERADAISYTGNETSTSAVSLVIDRSGSMGSSGMRDARESARIFTETSGNDDLVSVVSYSTSSRVDQPLVRLEDGRQDVLDAIDGLSSSGSTNIGDALLDGRDELDDAPDGTERATILMSDGIRNRGPTEHEILNDIVPSYNERGYCVYTIAFTSGADEAFMQEIADAADCGFYSEAADREALREVYADMRHEVSDDSTFQADSGTVEANESTDHDVYIDESVETATINVRVDGVDLGQPRVAPVYFRGAAPTMATAAADSPSVRLFHPDGTEIELDESSPTGTDHPDVEYSTAGDSVIYRLEDPASGEWRYEIENPTDDPVQYEARATGTARSELEVTTSAEEYRTGTDVELVATFVGESGGIPDATTTVTATGPAGDTVTRSLEETAQGVYRGTVPVSEAGAYEITVEAVSEESSRSRTVEVEVTDDAPVDASATTPDAVPQGDNATVRLDVERVASGGSPVTLDVPALVDRNGTAIPASRLEVESRTLRVTDGAVESTNVTVYVPEDVPAGTYRGDVRLYPGDGPVVSVPVAVDVTEPDATTLQGRITAAGDAWRTAGAAGKAHHQTRIGDLLTEIYRDEPDTGGLAYASEPPESLTVAPGDTFEHRFTVEPTDGTAPVVATTFVERAAEYEYAGHRVLNGDGDEVSANATVTTVELSGTEYIRIDVGTRESVPTDELEVVVRLDTPDRTNGRTILTGSAHAPSGAVAPLGTTTVHLQESEDESDYVPHAASANTATQTPTETSTPTATPTATGSTTETPGEAGETTATATGTTTGTAEDDGDGFGWLLALVALLAAGTVARRRR